MVRGALQGLPAPEVHTLKHGSHTGLEGHRTEQQGRCHADPGGSHKGWGCQDWRSVSKLEGGPQKPQRAKEGQAGGPWEDAWDPSPPAHVTPVCIVTKTPWEQVQPHSPPQPLASTLVPSAAPPGTCPSRRLGVRGLAAIATMGVSSLIPPDPLHRFCLSLCPATTRPPGLWPPVGLGHRKMLIGGPGGRLGCLFPRE